MNLILLASNIPDFASSAQAGIARGLSGLNQDSQAVAQSVSGSVGALTAPLVDSLQEKLLVEASAKVLSGSEQLLGSLIDVMA